MICVYTYIHIHTYVCIYLFLSLSIYIYIYVYGPGGAGLHRGDAEGPRARHAAGLPLLLSLYDYYCYYY